VLSSFFLLASLLLDIFYGRLSSLLAAFGTASIILAIPAGFWASALVRHRRDIPSATFLAAYGVVGIFTPLPLGICSSQRVVQDFIVWDRTPLGYWPLALSLCSTALVLAIGVRFFSERRATIALLTCWSAAGPAIAAKIDVALVPVIGVGLMLAMVGWGIDSLMLPTVGLTKPKATAVTKLRNLALGLGSLMAALLCAVAAVSYGYAPYAILVIAFGGVAIFWFLLAQVAIPLADRVWGLSNGRLPAISILGHELVDSRGTLHAESDRTMVVRGESSDPIDITLARTDSVERLDALGEGARVRVLSFAGRRRSDDPPGAAGPYRSERRQRALWTVVLREEIALRDLSLLFRRRALAYVFSGTASLLLAGALGIGFEIPGYDADRVPRGVERVLAPLPAPVPTRVKPPIRPIAPRLPAPARLAGTPPRAEIRRTLQALVEPVRACGPSEFRAVTTTIRISGLDGSVAHVEVRGPAAGTPLGRCIVETVSEARFPRFTRETFTISSPFVFHHSAPRPGADAPRIRQAIHAPAEPPM